MPETNKTNADSERIILDVANDDDEDDTHSADDIDVDAPDGDDTVIPPVEDTDAAPAAAGDDTDDAPDGNTADEDEDTTDQPDEPGDMEDDDDHSHPAPVLGETPKETALRIELTKTRKDLRKAQTVATMKEMATGRPAPVAPAVVEGMKKLKENYTDEELKNLEDAVDLIAASKGYVKKEETYQDTINSSVEDFVNSHPEYKPENDKKDERWAAFQQKLKSGLYNLEHKTPQQLKHIFAKANDDVIADLGATQIKKAPVREPLKIAAQKQKIAVVSHSGGTKSAATKSKAAPVDPTVRDHFKGFDDSDFE